MNARELRERLGSRKGFVWVKRAVTPSEQQEVFRLVVLALGEMLAAEQQKLFDVVVHG